MYQLGFPQGCWEFKLKHLSRRGGELTQNLFLTAFATETIVAFPLESSVRYYLVHQVHRV